MTDPQRFSRTHSDIFGLFKAELARAGAITGFLDAGASLWLRFAVCYEGVARLPRKARRALQRRWRRSLAGIALLHALGQVPAALAAQIDVGAGGCTLVDAITAANTDQQTGACPAGSGADTITLPAGSTQLLTAGLYSFYGPTGLPAVTSAIVIDGNGSTIARDPQAPEFRILGVGSAGDLVLLETTVTGGVISTPTSGGGISNFGTLTLTDSTVSGNSANLGGGVSNYRTLTLTNSTVSGNSAGSDSGGLRNYRGTLILTNSTVSGNSAAGIGGGVSTTGTLTLTDSTVSGNSAGYGGGVDNNGVATLANSTVSGNSARFGGGGVFNFSLGTLTLANSTVSGNSAGSDGGGVRNSGTLTLIDSTVSGNSASRSGGGVLNYAGTLTLDQSLVSGNSASSQGPEVHNSSGEGGPGILITNGFNLFGHDGMAGVDGIASGAPGATDLVPAVPLSAILDPALADNGGPTRTHALVIGGPAIDAVPVASCATAGDQRGVTRPQDGDDNTLADCDIGAFELQPPPPVEDGDGDGDGDGDEAPVATAADQDPRVRCAGFDCRVLIKCDAVQRSTEPCNTRVDVFIRASALRLAEDGAAKARRRIRFASAVTNIPAGETANVPLRLTKRGRRTMQAGQNRRLVGVMEIRNSIGPVQTVRVRIRIRR